MQNTVFDNEHKLYEYIKVRIPDLKKTDYDVNCPADCFSEKFKLVIELKCRSTHYERLILEKDKYDKLVKSGWRPLYICSTPNGIYCFDLKKITLSWQLKQLPRTTIPPTANIFKEITFLNIHQARKL